LLLAREQLAQLGAAREDLGADEIERVERCCGVETDQAGKPRGRPATAASTATASPEAY